jgi:hypothetical protein
MGFKNSDLAARRVSMNKATWLLRGGWPIEIDFQLHAGARQDALRRSRSVAPAHDPHL